MSESETRAAAVAQAPFRWPPAPVADGSSEATLEPSRPRESSPTIRTGLGLSIASAWAEIERVWLDPRTTSFARRCRESGWRADDLAAFCPRCAHSVGPYEADADGCSSCRSARLPWTRAVRLGPYDGLLREAIHDLKFSAFRVVGLELGIALGEQITLARTRAGLSGMNLCIVPVPTSTRRRLARRIDHTLTLSRGVARATGGRIVRALAKEHRPEQWAVAPSERSRNVSGAFRVRRVIPHSTSHVVLVDDVRTTGATLRSACRALRRSWRQLPMAERPLLWVAMVASAGQADRGAASVVGHGGVSGGASVVSRAREGRDVGAAVDLGKEK